ncbi:MAG TPA: hypothetical protein VMS22_18705 [Candidatus Eisenbacteria bacterium]|nr:hypothetical protein [Candidatus Eisenbacteria bacterium]
MGRLVRIGVALSLLGATDGGAAVLCKTRASTIVVRDACRAKEVPVALEGVGAPGPAGQQGPKGPTGPSPIRLVDSKSREVGPAVYVEWSLAASKNLLEGLTVIEVLVRRDALPGPALLGVDYTGKPVGTVYYTSTDCTGSPMVLGDTFLPELEAVGDTVFVPGLPASVTIANSNETSNFSGGCVTITPRGGCCKLPAYMSTLNSLLQASTKTLADLAITPPLHAVGP